MIAPGGGSSKSGLALWLTGLASAALFAVNSVWYAGQFSRELPHAAVPDKNLWVTPEDLLVLRERLAGNEAAAAILRTMHLTTDMVFPVVFCAFLFLLVRRLADGATWRGGKLPKTLARAFLTVPFLYMLSDYAENAIGLLLFPPAVATAETASILAFLLPWIIRLKFMFATIAGVIVLRLTLLRPQAENES